MKTKPAQIKPLSDDYTLHASWGSWERFLATQEVRDVVQGVTHYGSSNANYIVFPDGTLIENFGYNGQVVMAEVRAKGWRKALKDIVADWKAYKKAHHALCLSLDRLNAAFDSLADVYRRRAVADGHNARQLKRRRRK